MKKLLLILLTVILVGAGCKSMTNEEVIAETQKCEDAGMEATLGIRLIDYRTMFVACHPINK